MERKFDNGFLFAVLASADSFTDGNDRAELRVMLGAPNEIAAIIGRKELVKCLAAMISAAMVEDKEVAETIKLAIQAYNRNQKV